MRASVARKDALSYLQLAARAARLLLASAASSTTVTDLPAQVGDEAGEEEEQEEEEEEEDDETVVVLKETADWLNSTFRVPGFAPREGGRPLLSSKRGDAECGDFIESYADAKRFRSPLAFDAYLDALVESGNTIAARDAIATVSGVLKGTTVGKKLDEALRPPAGVRLDSEALMVTFRQTYEANEVIEKVGARPAGALLPNKLAKKMKGLKDVCRDDLLCVDMDALAPLLTGEVLRFDILPRLLVAAGWNMAPGADHAEAWYQRKGFRTEAAPPGWTPAAKDAPVSKRFKPEFGVIELDEEGKPTGAATLCLRASEQGSAGVWWGCAAARAAYTYADWGPSLRKWRELQPALALIGCEIDEMQCFRIVKGGKDGAHAVLDLLQDMRDKAIELRCLHRIVPYPRKLSGYVHPVKPDVVDTRGTKLAVHVALHVKSAARTFWDDVIVAYLLSPTADDAELRTAIVSQVAGLYAIMVSRRALHPRAQAIFAGRSQPAPRATRNSLLTVFVEQQCPSETPGVSVSHSCTFYEKTSADVKNNQRYWPRLVLAWNFVTFAFFLITNIVLFRREFYIIRCFDHAAYLPATYLHGKLKRTPNETAPADDGSKGEPGCLYAIRYPARQEVVCDELRKYPCVQQELKAHNLAAFACTSVCGAFLLVKCAHGTPQRTHCPRCVSRARRARAASSSRASFSLTPSTDATAAPSPSSPCSPTRSWWLRRWLAGFRPPKQRTQKPTPCHCSCRSRAAPTQ